MKFHNQKSFMGHEISNVKNKPLLHKKGKQWIVVAISALVLAGFGGMISTTTHADTIAQPTTAKVATQPANNSGNASNVMKQAQGMHKALANNAAVQKPSAPNSAAAKKTAPASDTSTTIAKGTNQQVNQSHNNLTSIRLTSPTPTSGTAGSDNKATWNISDNTNLYIHGNGVNWYWPNLNPYKNVYISDIHFHGPGHMFSGLTNLKNITFTSNVTNDAQYMDNDFNGDVNLQSITGLNNFMANDSHLIDYDYMFKNCQSLRNLDLRGLNSKNIPTTGQGTYDSSDNYTGDGNHNAFQGMTRLSQVELGPDTILYPSSQIPTVFKNTNNSNASAKSLDDGQAHPGTWAVFQGTHGKWGTADWILNSNGDLLLNNGQLSNVPGGNNNGITGPFNRNAVKHIYTNNVTPPDVTDPSNYGTGAYNLFSNFHNVQSIDLSGLNFSGCKVMTDMFYGDSDLQSINFGNNNSDSAALSNTVNGGNGGHNNGLNGFLQTTNNLGQITLGPNMKLPKNIYNTNNVSPVTIFGADQQHHSDVTKLTDSDSHPGTWNVLHGRVGNWGTATWAFDNNSGTLYLANGDLQSDDPKNHNIPWQSVKHIKTYKVTAPVDCNALFEGNNLQGDHNNQQLESIDLNGMDTSKVTNMSHMFESDHNLSDIKGLTDTSNVTNDGWMFDNDLSLKSLDLSNLNTLNVPDGNGHDNAFFYTVPALNTLILGPNTKLGANYNLPGSWINTANNAVYTGSQLDNNQVHPGTWTRDAEIIKYVYNNQDIGTPQLFTGPFNSTSTIGNTPKGLPANYQVSNPNEAFTFNGSVFPVNIKPIQKTDTINYQYNGRTLGSYKPTGNDYQASGASDTSITLTSSNASNMPNNYHLASNSTLTFDYNDGTYNVNVAPNTATDTINYVNDKNNFGSHQFTGNSANAASASDTSFTIGRNPSGLSAGYHVVNPVQSYNYTGSTYPVSVAPDSESKHINYNYNDSIVSSTTMNGAYNQSSSVTSAPANWHLANKDNSFKFGFNNTDNVDVLPDSAGASVAYQYNGKNVAVDSTDFKGNSVATNTSNDNININFNNEKGLPSGWHLVNKSTNIPYDNGKHAVSIVPNTIIDHINYQVVNGSYAKSNSILNSSEAIMLNDDRATSASGAMTTITSTGNTYVPRGYHMTSSSVQVGSKSTNSNVSSASDNVMITPNSEAEHINYLYNGKSVASTIIKGGYFDNSSSVSKVPTGWTMTKTNPNNKFTFGYNNDTDNVNITPLSASATVDYIYQNNVIASTNNYSGNNYLAGVAGNNSVNITSSNANNLPAGWHLVKSSTKVLFNNQAQPIAIVPNIVSDTIDYQSNGNTLATQQFGGNDYRATAAGDNSFNVTSSNDSSLPDGYKLVNKNNQFKFDGNNHIVDITPIQQTDTVKFINKENHKLVDKVTTKGNDYRTNVNGTSTVKLPSGYRLATGQSTTVTNDGKIHQIDLVPNSAFATVNYKYDNDTIASHKFVGNDDTAKNADDTSVNVTSSNKPDLPAGWHLAKSSTNVSFNNQTYSVMILPNHVLDTIEYQLNGKTLATQQFSGNDYRATQAGNNSVDVTITNAKLPVGYHLVNKNNSFNYDGNQHTVKIVPDVDTDAVNYRLNGKTIATQRFSGNDYRAVAAGDNSFDVNDKMPEYYHLANTKANVIKYDGNTHNVTVAPNYVTDTVNYMYSAMNMGTVKFTGVYGTNVDYARGVPSGYILSTNAPIKYDNGNHSVSLTMMTFNPISALKKTSNSSTQLVAKPQIHQPIQVVTPKVTPKPIHYRYIKIFKPLQLHTSTHFTKKNGVLTIKHPTEFKIVKTIRKHKYVRYEVRYQGKRYFITGNAHFTKNDYVQKSDFNSHKHMLVKVTTPMIEYKHIRYGKRYVVKDIKRGMILPVKRVITIGNGEMTRFELTNGYFATANKLFVKVI